MKRPVVDWILDDENIWEAIKRVKENKGVPGVDGMPVSALVQYFEEHGEEIKEMIRSGRYEASPLLRVWIPKPGGGQRGLSIPTVVDRVVQQMVAQVLSKGYERYFSESSYGYRPNSNCHLAMAGAVDYLNDGYTWVIDLDIAKYFDLS